MDDRFHDLAKSIWAHTRKIEAFIIAENESVTSFGKHFGGEYRQFRRDEEMALWSDLQTLFRRGVFPEDMPAFDEEALSGTLDAG